MIEVKNLTKYYGQLAAVQDVTFSVDKGEIVGFLGPNAAGKTTTMRMLTGFFPPTSGVATVAGFNVHEKPLEVKRRVGYLPESVPLYREMFVSKFLTYVAEVKGIARHKRAQEVGYAMERCGLSHMARRTIGNLSKGYRQRVGLAQALLGSPPVLILDEPTVGLDPKQIIEIRQTIKGLAEDHTVLLSTHILPEVAMICEQVIIIHEGRIVAQDSMANLTGGGKATLEIESPSPVEKVMAALAAVPAVGKVTPQKDGLFLVEADAEDGVSDAVAAAMVNGGLSLRALRSRTRTLEDVFVDAISTEPKGGVQ